ncbi:MAG: hypothetical protein L0G99_06795 [Propionibacteriales bacterium]|nr:hypothetical protein [Propionibacteriales bacterium]
MPMIESRLKDLGAIENDLSGLIAQGAYSDGSLSANTHAGGGAMDVSYSVVDTKAKVLAWRTSGVAMWPRTGIDSPKFAGNNQHGHGIWIGCPHLSSSAQEQVGQYRAGGDGLQGDRPDRFARPAEIKTWQEALKDWTDGTNPDTTPQEVLGMSITIATGTHLDKEVSANQTFSAPINGEGWINIISGPIATFMVDAAVTISGLNPGEGAVLLLTETEGDKMIKELKEIPINGMAQSWVTEQVSAAGSLREGRGLRIRVNNLTDHSIQIERTQVTGLRSEK